MLTFLAKFDNCASHNKWTDEEKLHYLANLLENPAAQILWVMQGCGSSLRRIYGSDDQAEVYRSQLKIRHRKKGESLTDLAQEIRKLMVLTYPGPPYKTTEMVARDAFLEALDDPELDVHIQAQNPSSLYSAVRVAQHMEAVLHSVGSQHSRPVRTLVREPEISEADEGAKEALANQGAMLKALQALTQKVAAMHGHRPTSDSKPYENRGPRFGTTRIICFDCGQEGHFKRNCPSASVGRSDPVLTPEPDRENLSVTAVGPNARWVYLDID